MTIVAKVWIDEDCITCDACQDICPEVFEITDESSQILAAVRTDGQFDRNTAGSLLSGTFGAEYGEMILEAAEACPVEVIKFELVGDDTVAPIEAAAPVVAA
ncbi:MAG: ferredoxin, partial [Euryarchaeota archaeon]